MSTFPADPIDDRDRPSPDWERPPEPPIHRAARKGDIAALAAALAAGADIDTRADLEFDNGPHLNGLTPLMVTARSIDGASVETLKWLLDHGADLRARSEGGNTAAWYAAGHGGRWEFHRSAVTPDHVRRLELLLDAGLDARECNFIGRSLLTEACTAGDPARVRLLLERKAALEPGSHVERDVEPEWLASMHPPDVPRGAWSSFQLPLFCAAESGSGECVRLLLKAGVDPNQRDDSGATPLMAAGSVAAAEALLAGGADVQLTDEFGKDALDRILEGDCCSGDCGPDRFDISGVLIAAGADIERRDRYGSTRIGAMAFGHHAEAVEFLLKLGARPDAADEYGSQPLHKICWQGEYADDSTNAACRTIIQRLVESAVSPDCTATSGATPLHEAASGDWGNVTAIRTLLELGAAPDPVDGAGQTPLMLAASNGEVACVEALLAAGADPQGADPNGVTAIDLAREHLGVMESLAAETPCPADDACPLPEEEGGSGVDYAALAAETRRMLAALEAAVGPR